MNHFFYNFVYIPFIGLLAFISLGVIFISFVRVVVG